MRTILIIEDNENLSRGISFLFEKDGFQTHVAPDLAAGRSILREQSFDLLILDLGLPDGDGIHFCAELREHSDIPIIILTARDMEIDEVSGLTAGADDYIKLEYVQEELERRGIKVDIAMIEAAVREMNLLQNWEAEFEILDAENTEADDGREA